MKFNIKSIFGSSPSSDSYWFDDSKKNNIDLTRFNKNKKSIKELKKKIPQYHFDNRRKSIDSSKTPIYEEIIIDKYDNISTRSSHASIVNEKIVTKSVKNSVESHQEFVPSKYESDEESNAGLEDIQTVPFNLKPSMANAKKKSRFLMPKIEKIQETPYDALNFEEKGNINFDLNNSNNSSKSQLKESPKLEARTKSSESKPESPKINREAHVENSDSHINLNCINDALKSRNRSKSLHNNIAVHTGVRKQSKAVNLKGMEEIVGPDMKRRNIIDVLRHFGNFSKIHLIKISCFIFRLIRFKDLPDESLAHQSKEFDEKLNLKGYDTMVNTGTIRNHDLSENNNEFMLSNNMPKNSAHKNSFSHENEHKEKENIK
jgi:hypothetical protein